MLRTLFCQNLARGPTTKDLVVVVVGVMRVSNPKLIFFSNISARVIDNMNFIIYIRSGNLVFIPLIEVQF